MSLDEQLGPFAGKFIDEVDPKAVESSQFTSYEQWVTKECGHILLFGDGSAVPDKVNEHVHRLSEIKDLSYERVVERIRSRYRTIVDRRLEEFRRNREQNPLDDFMAKYAQCYQLTTQIVVSLEDHLGLHPDEVSWSDVAEVGDAKKYLESAAYLLRVRKADR